MFRHVPSRALGSYAPGKYIRYENFGSHSDPHPSLQKLLMVQHME